ncbi:hypothetical protein SAMN05216352_1322 [Alteribacillus bidgolensis]|uniref:NodB homology domain-containing protein n=1 Tax=Alteribacillus bidgolensis TaxID=930129 RepID=A0A1G8RRC0_9BACI|nr:hypothetical protein SAMN05216352_1322 [Alteribacillus bidgolensis]
MWTADTKDWSGVSAEEIVSRVKQDASPEFIMLQHNYHSSEQFETVKALLKSLTNYKHRAMSLLPFQHSWVIGMNKNYPNRVTLIGIVCFVR